MDDANYQRLGGPHKRSGSICHVVCCTHSKMSSDDSRVKYSNQQEHIAQCDVGSTQPFLCYCMLSQSEFLILE